ncbi:RDD family protein [Sphaerisporangium rhizosphaerae]|uniref:RDD family protein n=1 Tax=Sphaerisporangium rhizosphaerae TaxID=2269375 RepID=A0ABW2P2I9_9ACTN
MIAARRHRFGASLIDTLILTVPGVAIRSVALSGPAADGGEQAAGSGWLDLWLANPYAGNPFWYLDVAVAIMLLLYLWICHAYWGQTIGKRLCRLRVVRADGTPLTPSQAGVRSVVSAAGNLIPYVGLLFSLVDGLWIFGPSKRCLHDVVAGTVVVDLKAVAGETGGRSGRPLVLTVGLLVIALPFAWFLWIAWG